MEEKRAEGGEEKGGQNQTPSTPESKPPRKRVRFNLPFIIGGLIAGVLAAAPYTQIANYFYGIWGFLGGLLGTYILSRSFKYFNYAQAAVVGMLSGIVATAFAIGASIAISFVGFDMKTLYPPFVKETLIPAVEKAQLGQVRGKILLPPWQKIKSEATKRGESAVTDWFVLNGLYLTGTLVCMAILGGFVGGVLFSKPVPKKNKYQVVRAVKRRKEEPKAAPSQDAQKNAQKQPADEPSLQKEETS
ncbi:MAG: hypothetical protein N2234_04675, partial [Planctomycetota bacterium]|nr:hypothetical protein [Planctomycetota bacterium]